MATLTEIRAKFPQYGDMTDAALADSIYKKYYSDVPRPEFDQKIGLAQTSAQSEQDYANMSAGDIAGQAVRNAPHSAANFLSDVARPITHPVETATTLFRDIPTGIAEKIGMVDHGGQDAAKIDAIWKFLVDRYGSEAALKKTLATDPVGVAADVSLLLTGGGSAAARVPGVAGKVGEVAATAGRAIDPLNAAVKGVGLAGKGAAQIAGVTTGAGPKAIETAFETGAQGGEAGKAFRDSFIGREPLAAVVDDAKAAVQEMRNQRGAEYRAAMKDVSADKTVLDFSKIDKAINDVAGVKTFKGQDLSPATADIRSRLIDTINEWKNLDPKEFHTPEGIDALKQKLGDIRDDIPYGTPARKVAGDIYGAVRQTIIDQVPEYAKVMKGYEEASSLIKEIEQTLSVNPKARVDTTLRKLQSVLRDNVNTNYGQRAALAKYLVDNGAKNLIAKLSGQALSKVAPRGLAAAMAEVAAAGGAGLGLTGTVGIPVLAKALPALAVASPMAVGGVAHGLGAMTSPLRQANRVVPLRPAAAASFQLGRLSRTR